ncbi:MAG: hypothetical protein E4H27_06600 [Anaerolineales bacterium]|nr:MAG: hypothetical protein E4H27_06600 [Anaerolineales bacterium]
MGSIYRNSKRQRAERHSVDVPHSLYKNVDQKLLGTAQTVAHFFSDLEIPDANLNMSRGRFLGVAKQKRDSALRRLMQVKKRRYPVKDGKLAWQFVVVVVVVTLMLFPVRGQMIVAAKDSLPGDALYLVKLATENSTVDFIEVPGVKALLILSFTDDRIDEIITLSEGKREIPLSAIYRTHRLLNTVLSYAAWAAEDDMATALDEVTQHIQIYVQLLEQAKTGAAGDNRVRLSDMQGRCLRLQLIVTAATMEPDVFRDAYRAGMPERLTTLSDPLGSDPVFLD